MFFKQMRITRKINLSNLKLIETTKSDNEKPKMMVGFSLKQILHLQGEFE